MPKRFQIKVYQKNGDIKETISPQNVMNDLRFTSQINGGQNELRIQLNEFFTYTDIIQGDFIRVYMFDDNDKNGRVIYTGFVDTVRRLMDINGEYIELIVLGLAALLNQIIYDNSGKTFNKTDDPSDIIEEIIDYVNTQYNTGSNDDRFSYSGGHIDTYGSNVNIDFSYTNCYAAIEKVVDATDFRWYIKPDGQVYFQDVPASAIHILTLKDDVERLDVKDTADAMVNKLYLERNGGTVTTYQDATSQSTYGLKEKHITESDIKDATTANSYGNAYIGKYKDPLPETSIIVNSRYDIESIKPGDTITITNIDYTLQNKQIEKIQYDVDKAVLYLEKTTSFGDKVVA